MQDPRSKATTDRAAHAAGAEHAHAHNHPHSHAHHVHLHPVPPPPPAPHRLRLALVLMLFVYPVITGLLYILVPLTEGWATWHRTLLITPIMVSAIMFVVTPLILRYLHWLVVPRRRIP
ncbi:hypothetical protein [Rhizobium oryzicola]|uniref:Transmembrane protein n=1 Tax=Rhizobium oryzicola TaxID=1232668 RepID=A0ABT8SRS5_9HYPH|nr:hypothetical protein [Rhizobium oryzicola]MDO1580583.1 hypothetical protein [Rhizobium oryzicola]